MKLAGWAFVFCSLVAMPCAAEDWPAISPADLSMTSIKEHPGAGAVVLLREETDDNMNNSLTVFERIKILAEAGRDYADCRTSFRSSLQH